MRDYSLAGDNVMHVLYTKWPLISLALSEFSLAPAHKMSKWLLWNEFVVVNKAKAHYNLSCLTFQCFLHLFVALFPHLSSTNKQTKGSEFTTPTNQPLPATYLHPDQATGFPGCILGERNLAWVNNEWRELPPHSYKFLYNLNRIVSWRKAG